MITTLVSSAGTVAASSGGGISNAVVASLISGAVIAAIIGAVINIWLTRRRSLDDERSRVRSTCAEAFQAVADYKEYPYAIRRRDPAKPDAERVRLSEGLREVQSRLSYFTVWMKGESAALGDAYGTLVGQLRRVAGGACHDAWLANGAGSDSEMNVPATDVDLSGLAEYEDTYIASVQAHLAKLTSMRRLWLGR